MAVVIVLQLDCILSTLLALLLLFRTVVNTKVGSDFNLSKNAKHVVTKIFAKDKMWTRNQQMMFSFCGSMIFDQTCKNTCDLFLFHQKQILQKWF